jgi:predicted nucleotidyltransferase
MNLEQAISTLRSAEPELRARGVKHAGLFGSVARGDNCPESDVDVLVEFDSSAQLTIFDYVGLKDHFARLFGSRVDVIDRDAIKPHLRQSVTQDLVHVF